MMAGAELSLKRILLGFRQERRKRANQQSSPKGASPNGLAPLG